MIQYYFSLIKPGIVIGNIMSSIGGFLMASQEQHINYMILINMIIGLALVIASSCVLNNIIDRDIDAIMMRTNTRILAQQKKILSIKNSIFYALILNISGFLLLYNIKNFYTIFLSAIGFIIYVVLYSLYMKRKSSYGMIAGSLSGAMPPVIGYCTVTNTFDCGALILLMIFSFWQIPHSYSITIFRHIDYKNALIPTFFIKKGMHITRIHILTGILGFCLSTILLTVKGYTSYIFLCIISIFNLFWLYTGWYKYKYINNDSVWAKKMFILSIIIIILLNLMLSLDVKICRSIW
ncbi:heme o synthase [Candidatus Blochmanniella vafra]|uniref:heme o synthase n=1 Tax=Candidatus Blochmanniella vafra TaxID=251535 RepID=UPI0005C7A109|nr:heme o synthase [Candidatus Blochmannia vafer]